MNLSLSQETVAQIELGLYGYRRALQRLFEDVSSRSANLAHDLHAQIQRLDAALDEVAEERRRA